MYYCCCQAAVGLMRGANINVKLPVRCCLLTILGTTSTVYYLHWMLVVL